jgi:hypothetical protein
MGIDFDDPDDEWMDDETEDELTRQLFNALTEDPEDLYSDGCADGLLRAAEWLKEKGHSDAAAVINDGLAVPRPELLDPDDDLYLCGYDDGLRAAVAWLQASGHEKAAAALYRGVIVGKHQQ